MKQNTAGLILIVTVIGILALAIIGPKVGLFDFDNTGIHESGTIVLTVESNHILLDANYTLYENNKVIKTFTLHAYSSLKITMTKTWMNADSKTFNYILKSTGGGTGDQSASGSITLHDNETKSLTLRA